MACAGQLIWETAMAGVQRCKENLMADVQHLGRKMGVPIAAGRLLRDAQLFFLCNFLSVIFLEMM